MGTTGRRQRRTVIGLLGAVAVAAGVAVADSGPAVARPHDVPSGSCKPSWKNKPAEYGHRFKAEITSDPCGVKVEGAVLCFVNVTDPTPPGSSSASTYWVYGRGEYSGGKTSEADCPDGPPLEQSRILKYGVRYKLPLRWYYSDKKLS